MKFFFRVDCSSEVGFGHLNRCLNLALFLKKESSEIEFHLYILGLKSCDKLPGADLFKKIFYIDTSSLLSEKFYDKYDVGIFDFSTKNTRDQIADIGQYFIFLKEITKKTILFDGLGNDSLWHLNSRFMIDALVVPYVAPVNEEFHHDNLYIGPQFFIFSQDLLNLSSKIISEEVSTILLTMGGADPFELSLKLLLALEKSSLIKKISLSVAIGPYFSLKLINEIEKIVDRNQCWKSFDGNTGFYDKLAAVDLCISSVGLTKYELAKLGVPTILIAPNDLMNSTNLSFASLNTAYSLGVAENLSDNTICMEVERIILSKNTRMEMSENGKKAFRNNGMLKIKEFLLQG